jgi:ribosomal protein S18 acetylase RimI-like enzyme
MPRSAGDVKVRNLEWGDFRGWADLYYSRYAELPHNPELGVYVHEKPPTDAEEAMIFGQFMQQIIARDLVAVVAEDDGRLVGACTLGRRGRHPEQRHIGVLGVAVHPDHRGRGVGKALLELALSQCPGLFEMVELKAIDANPQAIGLYRKFGFVEFGRQPRAFKRGDRYFDDVYMWRAIEPVSPPGARKPKSNTRA